MEVLLAQFSLYMYTISLKSHSPILMETTDRDVSEERAARGPPRN